MDFTRVSSQDDETRAYDAHDDGSDADSDLEELQGDIAKLEGSVREFLASQHGETSFSPAVRGGTRGRGARGPRKAAKPRGDITARLSKVNQAFLSGDYARALDLAFEVIRINAETHQAWTALSSIFREQGEMARALSTMVYAAHLRPKDVFGWLGCASFALDTITDDESDNLHTARLCYSAAIRADPTNVEARLGKAAVCHRQGHLAAAISEYNMVLKNRPQDLDIVRKLAEACVDNKHAETAIPSAISAYQKYFELAAARSIHHSLDAPWHDVGIYVELYASTGRYQDAIWELKALSRWLVGRGHEKYWDNWQTDDREWDADDSRRQEIPDFVSGGLEQDRYGSALPYELRIRLAIYRLRLGDQDEAFLHMSWLDPTEQHTMDFVNDFSFLVYELASALARSSQPTQAITYFELLRTLPGDADPMLLLQLGRCYLTLGAHSSAEECFLASIEADEAIIEARVELANLYEQTREDEEALILAAEAMALRRARENDTLSDPELEARSASAFPLQPVFQRHRQARARTRRDNAARTKPVVPRRYRPKRLAGPDKRQQDEQARALKLSEQYRVVRELKQKIADGHENLIPAWMASSEELINDFRSLKKFYTWDKYLHFLGKTGTMETQDIEQPENELALMYERLSRSLAPQVEGPRPGVLSSNQDNHQGISFDNWLDLFLDYAIGLAVMHRRDEAYQVCEAARDSTVFQTPKYVFSIYVAWSVCAIYTSDEEKCVATARHLMRDSELSDSYRMFALLSYLCQSPASWYTSGPAQKFILRQIKGIDMKHEIVRTQSNETMAAEPTGADRDSIELDVCLLMLYGHILFTSASYTFALGYFLRARALDPENAMVNLSLGLAYVHYGLKRQSANRQYLFLQGQAFLASYTNTRATRGDGKSLAEIYYNLARLFQLLGIMSLAMDYYIKAIQEVKREDLSTTIKNTTIFNSSLLYLTNQNTLVSYLLINKNIIL
ncbi:RNA polymerase III transcription initiation factor complex [Stachybotrys elegans]|uniref:RNA polymerase III transcription initiation factor complex n=1 Tax=Stachybotrys elegans TaxID=80388 RepID=A0A8K0WQL9_9HYPO|nr:RNA polymerase III transcription initiation factor complex [Stachybotrys elegans]